MGYFSRSLSKASATVPPLTHTLPLLEGWARSPLTCHKGLPSLSLLVAFPG